ncbi:MAG: class I SAM-dependent methyltransferase [Solirubrobacterales bacterium]|nr:class I SAM-dependent methyltransferase [Solirubrobacterales bacterium]
MCESPPPAVHYLHNRVVVSGWTQGASRVNVALGPLVVDAETESDGPDNGSGGKGSNLRYFETSIDTSDCPRGVHTLAVAAIPHRGRPLRVHRTVMVEPYQTPDEADPASYQPGRFMFALDMPSLRDGQDREEASGWIRGWCYTERGVDRVQVFLDGRSAHDALFPSPRKDVWRAFGSRDMFLSGYELELDEEACPPGEHLITVMATAHDGRRVGQAARFNRTSHVARGISVAQDEHSEDGTFEQLTVLTHLERLARYRWMAQFVAGRTVLDAGCGSGEGSAIFARAGAARVVAVDISERALDTARLGSNETTEFVRADMTGLPFADAEFDVIACLGSFERLWAPIEVLDEFRRVLRRGGLVAISTADTGEDGAVSEEPPRFYSHRGGSLEFALRSRWRNVAVVPQDSHIATAVGAAGPTATPILAGSDSENPARAIGLASDAPLPDTSCVLIHRSSSELKQLREALWLAHLRANIALKHALASVVEANAVQESYAAQLRKAFALERQLRELRRGRRSGRFERSGSWLRPARKTWGRELP